MRTGYNLGEKFKIDQGEILANLGHQGQEITKDIQDMIDEATRIIQDVAKPRSTYQVFDIGDPRLSDILIGQDIKDLLDESKQVICMGLTLGHEIEMQIRKLGYTDLTLSLVLDATASAAIESKAEELNSNLQDLYEDKYLTDRFSPGYGDLPICVQGDFIKLIGATKQIGLTTNPQGIMVPRKSITALVGIADRKQESKRQACKSCRLYQTCQKRDKKECGYGR